MNNGFPNLTLSYVRSIHREDIRIDNADGTHWVYTRMYFKNAQGVTLFSVALTGDETVPELKTTPMKTTLMRDSILDQQL